uniref:Integrase catalytic domain-containing protein n=1 Tax=Rhabditophanes sp. KR3021 TaxID=114890 RepID=A0AC35U5K2_9BILA
MPYLKNVQINDDGLSKVKFADINNEGQMNIVVNELEHPQTREVKYASQHSAEQNSVYSYQIPKGMKPVVRESTQNMKDVTEKNEFLQQYGTKIIHSTENTIKTFEQLAKDLQQHTTMTESNFMCANTIKLHEEMLAAQYNRIKYLHRELLDNQILLKNHQSVIFAIDNTQDDNPDLAPIVSMLKGINIEDVKDKYSKLYLQHKEEDQKINNRMNDHKKLLQTEEHLQELAHIGKATEDIVRLITQDPKSSLLVVSLIRKYQDERNGKVEKRYFKSNDMANNNDGVTLENSINNATNQQSSINAVNQQHTYVTNGQKVINSIVNGINDKEGIIGAKQSASKSNNTVRVQHQQSKANSKINTKNYKNVQKTIAKTPARKRIVKTNLASAPQTSNSPLQNSGITENSIHRRQENGSKHNEAGMLAGSSNKKVISGTVVDMEEIFKSVIDSAHYSNIQSNDTPESAKPDDLIRNYVSNVPSSIANNTPNLYTNRQQMSHVDNDIHTFGGNNTNDTQSPNEIEPSFYTNVVTSNTTMAHQQMNYIQKNQQIFEHETVEHLYQTNNAGHLMSDGNVQQQVIYSSQVLNNNHQQILVNNYSQNNHVDNSMTQMNSNNGCTSNIVRESNSYQGDSNSNHYEQAIFSSLNNNQSYQIDNTGMHYQVPIHESIAFNSNYFNNSTSHTNSTQMIVDNGDLQQNNNVHLSGDHSSNMDINSSNDYQHSTSNSLAQNNANAINQNKEFPAIYADSWYPQNNHLDNNGNNSATNMVNNGGYQEINGHNSNDNLNSLVSDNSCYDNHETDSNNMIFDAENNDCLNEMDWDHEMSP